MRHRLLVPIAVAVLYGCTDQTPTGPQPQVEVGGTAHLGAFAGTNGKIAFSGNGIQTINADASGLQTVAVEGFAPAYSPDGSRIAFIKSDGDNEVYVMNADGSGLTQLTFDTANEQAPSWSADGSKIGFSSDAGGVTQIYTVPAAGGTPTPLTSGSAANFAPAWSPTGSKIAFTSRRDGHNEIYVMNADGTGQTRLTNDLATSYDPSWSPDGTKIAFTRNEAFLDVYVMNADGTSPVNLTPNTASTSEYAAAFSPDGSKIVFIGDATDGTDVFIMNPDGTSPTNITNSMGIYESLPDWQPVPSVAQQIQALINYLDQLGLQKNIVNPLKSPLLNALAAANANDTALTCSYIADFISKTTAQNAKKLPADVAADLIQRARAISDRLGCTVPASKCYIGLPAPQLVLESTTVESPNVRFEFNVTNYSSFPNELFAQAPDLPPCGANTRASRTFVDVYDGNDNRLFGFCAFGQSSDLNGVWFGTTIAEWPAQAYIKLTDRRCNITYTSNKVNLASIL